jgi:hypothetical protein
VGKEDQLQWERKWAPAAAVSAFVAALLPLAGSIWTQSLLGSLPTSHSEDAFLRQVHSHSSAFVGAGVLTSIGTLFLSPAFAYLYRATRARRPQIPKIALFLLLLAPLATAGAGIARAAVIANTANQYVAEPLPPTTTAEKAKLGSITDPKKYEDEAAKNASAHARKKLTSGSIATVTYVGLVANLLVGVAYVLLAMHAMRAGLMSRFMGILGVIVGALTAVPILGGAPLPLQLFWLIALGVLFVNRWPQGRGPAWEEVEAIPWPTAQERRDASMSGREGEGKAEAVEPDAEPEVHHTREAARPRPSTAHPRSKKRKRKRRG